LYAGPKSARNILTNLSPNPTEKPGQTYSSGLGIYEWCCWCQNVVGNDWHSFCRRGPEVPIIHIFTTTDTEHLLSFSLTPFFTVW